MAGKDKQFARSGSQAAYRHLNTAATAFVQLQKEVVVALPGTRVASSDNSTDFDSVTPMTIPARHSARALFIRNPSASMPASFSTQLGNMAVSFRVFRLKLIPVMFLVIATCSTGYMKLLIFSRVLAFSIEHAREKMKNIYPRIQV
jgi:hypothetical protein